MEKEVRRTLRELARFEMPKRFVLIAQRLPLESGEMTPTLKVKRRVVDGEVRALIEAVYAG